MSLLRGLVGVIGTAFETRLELTVISLFERHPLQSHVIGNLWQTR